MYFQATLIMSLTAIVAGHGALTEVKGLNGVMGTALAITATPRTGAGARPFQQDTSVIRDRDIASGATSACGKTKESGAFDMVAMTDAVAAKNNGQLPSIRSGEPLQMTIHQVNQDGAGPYMCDISADGATFMRMEVMTNVPGVNSLSLATAKDMPLVVRIPAAMTSCTGGSNGATCIVRCRNAAVAGPFGGCAPVMMDVAADAQVTVPTATATVDKSLTAEVAIPATPAPAKRSIVLRAGEGEEEEELDMRRRSIRGRVIVSRDNLGKRDAPIVVEDDEYLQ